MPPHRYLLQERKLFLTLPHSKGVMLRKGTTFNQTLTKSMNTTQTMDKAGNLSGVTWEDQRVHVVPHAAATLRLPSKDAAQHRQPQSTKTSIMWSSNRGAKNRSMGRE